MNPASQMVKPEEIIQTAYGEDGRYTVAIGGR